MDPNLLYQITRVLKARGKIRVLTPKYIQKTVLELAQQFHNEGNYNFAIQSVEWLLKAYRRTLKPEDLNILLCLGKLVYYCAMDRNFIKAIEIGEEGLELHMKVLGPEHPDTLLIWNHLSICLRENGDLDRALELGEQCYKMRISVLGSTDPDTINSLNNITRIREKIENQRANHNVNMIASVNTTMSVSAIVSNNPD